jgi:hypothetical protein
MLLTDDLKNNSIVIFPIENSIKKIHEFLLPLFKKMGEIKSGKIEQNIK